MKQASSLVFEFRQALQPGELMVLIHYIDSDGQEVAGWAPINVGDGQFLTMGPLAISRNRCMVSVKRPATNGDQPPPVGPTYIIT